MTQRDGNLSLRSRLRWVLAMVFAVSLLLVEGVAQPQNSFPNPHVGARAASAAGVLVENLPGGSLKSLPPGALVVYRGQTMTKANFIAQRTKEWGAANSSGAKSLGPSDPQAVINEIKRRRTAELTARNAELQTEFEKAQNDAGRSLQSPQYLTLTKEALDLRNRYKLASPEEKARIKQRASEVYSQLVQIEKSVTSVQR